MAVDNPSYFSLSGEGTTGAADPGASSAPTSKSLSAFFRKRAHKMGTSGSSGAPGTALQHSGFSAEPTPSSSRHEAGVQPRRGFRSLFRSISANTDTSQFLRGDPRPSDIAPPSPCLPHRSHSHSEHDHRGVPGRRRVLKSTSELLSNDMVFCGVTGEDTPNRGVDRVDGVAGASEDSDNDGEVFLGVDDARSYYNVATRRHSIGTFVEKEPEVSPRGRSRTNHHLFPEPETMAPPRPNEEDENCGTGSKSRRRRRRSSGKGSRSGTSLHPKTDTSEDDVVFVSSKDSEAARLWVNYLTACFEQISRQQGRPPFGVRHVNVEDPLLPGTEEKRIKSSRLQIIVVCPVLLERIAARPEQATSLSKQLATPKVLAMMLGVHDGHVTDTHKSCLFGYQQWRKFFVKDQDETFVGEFLGAAVAILGNLPASSLRSDKTSFSVHPKKVKLGQNKILVLLNDPLNPEDNVCVIVDRCGEAIEVSHVKRRNPYTLQFSVPEKCLEMSMLVGVRIIKNGCPLGVRQVKCESRLRELDQILRAHDNPLEFMCQTFGFNPADRDQLDNWMVHAFQRNIPPHFNLLSTPSGVVATNKNHTSPEENPTLLHFAARFGLEKLAWQLLECPGGDLACDLRNASELTPADLAENAGHAKLAHQLRGYMQMNEFTNMYSYLKVMSENTSNSTSENAPTCGTPTLTTCDGGNKEEDYCRPRPLSEAYSVPPAARPLTMTTFVNPPQVPTSPLEANYTVVPTPTPVVLTATTATSVTTATAAAITAPTSIGTGNGNSTINANGLDLPLQGYMKMYPTDVLFAEGARTPTSTTSSSRLATPTKPDCLPLGSGVREGSTSRINGNSKSREPSGPQDELLEIINDFKNNVFTISEVERLVENWRNRNDVQQSFKDKQKQLNAMREEYERIQKKLKEEMKTTPFEKIRKFFSKGKKDAKETTSSTEESCTNKSTPGGPVNPLNDRRPVSSLSLHSVSSSSSSGRMSTVSGCSGTSLGDSGTHSDPEDRRLQNNPTREDKGEMMSYEIPPAAKPAYSSTRYSPSPRPSVLQEQMLRPPSTCARTEDSQYYITFPPSGLPIHSFKVNNLDREREPRTPGTPSEPSDYSPFSSALEQNQNNIHNHRHHHLEDANNQPRNFPKKPTSESYANIDPTTPASSAIIPPPGMCIPSKEYMNLTPCAPDSCRKVAQKDSIEPSNGPREATEHRDAPSIEKKEAAMDLEATTASGIVSGTVPGIASGSASGAASVPGIAEEYVESNVTRAVTGEDSCPVGQDVPDSLRMPDYMNLGGNSSGPAAVAIVGMLPKKLPAPPVPPRASSKK